MPTSKRIQAIKFQLARGQILACSSIFFNRNLNPVPTNNVAINHETKSIEDVALICHETFGPQAINLYASI